MKHTTHLNSQKIISGFVPKQLSFDYKMVESHLDNFYKLHNLKGNKNNFFDLGCSVGFVFLPMNNSPFST